MKRLGYLRLDKTVEIIGLDIAELGGMSEEIYKKITLEFNGIMKSPINSRVQDTSRSDLLLNTSDL